MSAVILAGTPFLTRHSIEDQRLLEEVEKMRLDKTTSKGKGVRLKDTLEQTKKELMQCESDRDLAQGKLKLTSKKLKKAEKEVSGPLCSHTSLNPNSSLTTVAAHQAQGEIGGWGWGGSGGSIFGQGWRRRGQGRRRGGNEGGGRIVGSEQFNFELRGSPDLGRWRWRRGQRGGGENLNLLQQHNKNTILTARAGRLHGPVQQTTYFESETARGGHGETPDGEQTLPAAEENDDAEEQAARCREGKARTLRA